MIRITIELCSAITGKTTTLATGTISNDCTGTKTRGNYNVHLCDKAGRPWKEGKVHGFARKQLLAWDLLYRALNSTVGHRNFRS
jgi:hypothetical protein